MKRWIFTAMIMLISASVSIDVYGDETARADEDQDKSEIVSVEDYMKNIDDYPDSVVVEGVVSSVMPDDKIFTMIDVEEFRRCGVTNCAALTLPVSWSGDMPEEKDVLTVSGRVEDSDGKFIFVADAYEKIELSEEKAE